jgi:hypothetical protein
VATLQDLNGVSYLTRRSAGRWIGICRSNDEEHRSRNVATRREAMLEAKRIASNLQRRCAED